MKTIVAYIPVLHQGYLNFFNKNQADQILVLGRSISNQFRPLQKDIRALAPQMIVDTILALALAKEAKVIEKDDLTQFSATKIVMPDEEISRSIASRYFASVEVDFDQVFLRWDASHSLSTQKVQQDETVSTKASDKKFIQLALNEASKSSDWWRQVGAVIVKDDQILLTGYNRHLPSEHQPYIDGDPRADFHKGEHIDKSTALHAEAGLIAQAAKEGISLEGTLIYVTTFPCPNCAKLIAASGIKELYFSQGYSILDGERVLKAKQVKIIKVTDE